MKFIDILKEFNMDRWYSIPCGKSRQIKKCHDKPCVVYAYSKAMRIGACIIKSKVKYFGVSIRPGVCRPIELLDASNLIKEIKESEIKFAEEPDEKLKGLIEAQIVERFTQKL